MGRRLREYRQVRLNGVFHAVFLKELLGAFQVLVDVCHSCGLPSWNRSGGRSAGGARASLPKLYTAEKRRAKTLRIVMRNCARRSQGLTPAISPQFLQF